MLSAIGTIIVVGLSIACLFMFAVSIANILK